MENLDDEILMEGKRVEFTGNGSLARLKTSYKSLIKIVNDETERFWIEMVPREEGLMQETKQVHPGVRELLEEFKHLFREPHGLPLRRMHDHPIRLANGASPSNLRPY